MTLVQLFPAQVVVYLTGCGVSDRASFMQGLQHATIFSWWSTKWLQ